VHHRRKLPHRKPARSARAAGHGPDDERPQRADDREHDSTTTHARQSTCQNVVAPVAATGTGEPEVAAGIAAPPARPAAPRGGEGSNGGPEHGDSPTCQLKQCPPFARLRQAARPNAGSELEASPFPGWRESAPPLDPTCGLPEGLHLGQTRSGRLPAGRNGRDGTPFDPCSAHGGDGGLLPSVGSARARMRRTAPRSRMRHPDDHVLKELDRCDER